MDLSAMDYVRAAIANARDSGLSIDDLGKMAEYAASAEKFDEAVNELCEASYRDEQNVV